MKMVTTTIQMVVRLLGVVQIVLGLLFWTGNAYNLIQLHMLLGIALVVGLWTLAVLAAVVRVNWGLVVLAIVWGFVVPVLGVTQGRLLPGDFHWVIQVLHLLVGVAAIGMADRLAEAIKRRRSPALEMQESNSVS